MVMKNPKLSKSRKSHKRRPKKFFRTSKRSQRATKLSTRSLVVRTIPEIRADRMKGKFHWQTEYGVGANKGIVTQFSLNGPGDVQSSFGTYAPAGFTEWMNQYYNYKCYGSKIEVNVTNSVSGTAGFQPYLLMVIPFGTALGGAAGLPSTANGWGELASTAYAKQIVPTPEFPQATLKSYMSSRVIDGRTKAEWEGDPNYQSLYSGLNVLPFNEQYWGVYINSADFSSNIPNARLVVKLTYYVQMYNAIVLLT